MRLDEKKVISLMEWRGVTQKQMADTLHINPTTLHGYVHAKYHHVDDAVIRDIADYLDVSIDSIIDHTDLRQTAKETCSAHEAILLDNYRHLNAKNKKVLEILSDHLLNEK